MIAGIAFFWMLVSDVKLFYAKACFSLSLIGKSENLSPENTSAFFSSGALSCTFYPFFTSLAGTSDYASPEFS